MAEFELDRTAVDIDEVSNTMSEFADDIIGTIEYEKEQYVSALEDAATELVEEIHDEFKNQIDDFLEEELGVNPSLPRLVIVFDDPSDIKRVFKLIAEAEEEGEIYDSFQIVASNS